MGILLCIWRLNSADLGKRFIMKSDGLKENAAGAVQCSELHRTLSCTASLPIFQLSRLVLLVLLIGWEEGVTLVIAHLSLPHLNQMHTPVTYITPELNKGHVDGQSSVCVYSLWAEVKDLHTVGSGYKIVSYLHEIGVDSGVDWLALFRTTLLTSLGRGMGVWKCFPVCLLHIYLTSIPGYRPH